jgi:MFS family permease
MRPDLQTRWQRLAEGLPASFWALLVGLFITRAGSFIVPLLFVYLTQRRGLTLEVAGMVVSLYGLGSLIGSLAGGALADRIGRRGTMLGSLVAGAASMLLLGASSEPWQLAGATLLTGFTGDAYRPAAQALVADVVAPEHRLKAFGIQYWAINLGFTLAALVGGFMATRSFTALFVGDAATTLALAAIVYRLVPESRPAAAAQPVKGGLVAPFVDRRYLPFLVLNFLIVLVFFQHLSGLPEDMRSKGLDTLAYGVAISTNGVLIVLLQPAVTQRVQTISRAVLLAVACALTGLGFALTGLATTLPWYMATVALWTLGEIVFAPVNASIVAELSPVPLRGRYQGAFTITWSLAAMVSPLVGPWLIAHLGLDGLWVACGVVGAAVATAHLWVTPRLLRVRPPLAG